MKRGVLVKGEGDGVEYSKKRKTIRKVVLLDMTGHTSVSGEKTKGNRFILLLNFET